MQDDPTLYPPPHMPCLSWRWQVYFFESMTQFPHCFLTFVMAFICLQVWKWKRHGGRDSCGIICSHTSGDRLSWMLSEVETHSQVVFHRVCHFTWACSFPWILGASEFGEEEGESGKWMEDEEGKGTNHYQVSTKYQRLCHVPCHILFIPHSNCERKSMIPILKVKKLRIRGNNLVKATQLINHPFGTQSPICLTSSRYFWYDNSHRYS